MSSSAPLAFSIATPKTLYNKAATEEEPHLVLFYQRQQNNILQHIRLTQSHSEEGDLKTDVGTTTNTNVHVVYAFLTFLSLRLANMLDAL